MWTRRSDLSPANPQPCTVRVKAAPEHPTEDIDRLLIRTQGGGRGGGGGVTGQSGNREDAGAQTSQSHLEDVPTRSDGKIF